MRRFFSFLIFVMLMVAFHLLLQQARAEIVNGIACKVGNSIITINEFNKAYAIVKKQALLMGVEAPSKKDLMEGLINELLVKTEAEKRGIVVTEEEVNKIIDNIKVQNQLNEEQFKEELEKEGLSLVDLKERYRKDMLRARLINQMGAEKRMSVSDEELTAFFNDPANRDFFTMPAVIKLSQLFVPVPENASYKEALEIKNKATSVYEEAKRGENFQALVLTYSGAPGKEKTLGSLGSFTEEQLLALLPHETVSLIFSLDNGDVTPPVRYREGYYIFKIDEKVTEKTLSYEEARENIMSYLYKKKGDEQFITWLSEKKQLTKIQYMINVE